MEEQFPVELQEVANNFHTALSDMDSTLKLLHESSLEELEAKLSPLERARLELTSAFAMNSLFWMYLYMRGENPREHPIKQEMERIQKHMLKVREVEDKAKAPKLDKDASKRFMRNALWQQAHKASAADSADASGSSASAAADEPDKDASQRSMRNTLWQQAAKRSATDARDGSAPAATGGESTKSKESTKKKRR